MITNYIYEKYTFILIQHSESHKSSIPESKHYTSHKIYIDKPTHKWIIFCIFA